MDPKKKKTAKPKRLVWRMTDRAPMGEWVDLDARTPPPAAAPDVLPEVTTGGWVVSSFDLLKGTDVDDGPNTVPDDLFDELFGNPATRPAPAEPEKPGE